MKKKLSIFLCLTLLLGLLTVAAAAAESSGFVKNKDTLWRRYELISAESGQKENFVYTVPEGGAAVLVFFNTQCTICKGTFENLSRHPWINSEKLNFYALESVNHSPEDIRGFAENYAGDAAEAFEWYAAGGSAVCSSYLKVAGDSASGWTWPVVIVCTEEDGVKYIRYSKKLASDFYELGLVLEKITGSDLGIADPGEIKLAGEKNYDCAADAAELINSYLESNGAPALNFNAKLSELAMLRAMEYSLFKSQVRPSTGSYSDLLEEEFDGFELCYEIEADFADSPANFMQIIRGNSDHAAQLLSGNYSQMGLGCFRSGNGWSWIVLLTDDAKDKSPAALSGSEEGVWNILAFPYFTDGAALYPGELTLYPGDSEEISVYNSAAKSCQLVPCSAASDVIDSQTGAKIAEAKVQPNGNILISAIAPGSGTLSLPLYEGQAQPPTLNLSVSEEEIYVPFYVHGEVEGSGQLNISKTQAKAGEKIEVRAAPASGCSLSALYIEDESGNYVSAYPSASGYFFFMPQKDVYIKAVFKSDTPSSARVILTYNEGGTVTASPKNPEAGEGSVITIAPAPGYTVAEKHWLSAPESYLWGDDFNVIFTMPDYDVELYVRFEALPKEAGGSFGEALSWRIEDDRLIISGKGSMGDSSDGKNIPWLEYSPSIREVVIEDGVEDIFSRAFENMPLLEKVSIADSVTSVYNRAFADCPSLKDVTLPASLTKPGNAMFYGCSALESITLPSALTEISAYCFENCGALKNILFPDALQYISESAFENCTALTSVNFPESLSQIGDAAFAGCTALESIAFSAKPYSIDETAFSDVSARVSVPAGDKDWRDDFTLDYGGSLSWNHSYSSSLVEPSCTEEGYTLYSCTCGDSEKDDFTDALGHDFLGWFVSSPKEESRSCTRCGSSESRAVTATVSSTEDFTPFPSNNIDEQSYDATIWVPAASVMRSYLVPLDEGGFMRVEFSYLDSYETIVEYYDSKLKPQRQLRISEGTFMGGFFEAADSYFIVYGYGNYDRVPGIEAIRVVRYDKDWNRLSSASYSPQMVIGPFGTGSLRTAEADGKVYIHTNATTYSLDDNSWPQTNFSFELDIEGMTIDTVNFADVSNSFNQFIRSDGNSILTLDHGNAYPSRSIILSRHELNSETGYWGKTASVNTLPIGGSLGDSYTGTSLGGFEVSSAGYLTAGVSIDQSKHEETGMQNVYVSFTPRDSFDEASTVTRFFTDFEESDGLTMSTPLLVKINENRFLLMWNRCGDREEYSMRYLFLNGKGEAVSEEFSCGGLLSDCQPIVWGDSVYWYHTGSVKGAWTDGKIGYFTGEKGGPAFFSINCQSGEFSVLEDIKLPCAHNWSEWYSAGVGKEERVCLLCGEYDTRFVEVEDDEDTESLFDDVRPTDWFAECVTWAVENNITGGVGNNLFAPNNPCTRGQALTFIWRMLGEPAPESLELPFGDVVEGAYYHKAVCWGVEKGIVNGMSETEFAPNAPCTRAQIVAMLWRIMDEREPDLSNNPFADVKATSWFVRPVLWAVEEGITLGMSADRFEPNTTCTRAQIVTFLYRMKDK